MISVVVGIAIVLIAGFVIATNRRKLRSYGTGVAIGSAASSAAITGLHDHKNDDTPGVQVADWSGDSDGGSDSGGGDAGGSDF